MVEGDIDEARAGARSLYTTRTTPLGRTVVGSAVSGLVSERGVDGRRPTAADDPDRIGYDQDGKGVKP